MAKKYVPGKSVILRKGEPDPYRKASGRALFFRKYPDASLVAEKTKDGSLLAFCVLCPYAGCTTTMPISLFEKKKIKTCQTHKHPIFDGVPLRRSHLVRLKDRLVQVRKVARMGSGGKNRYLFYVLCDTPSCKGLVDVTASINAKKKKVCQKCSYITAPRMFVDKKAKGKPFTSDEKSRIHKKIVGYFIQRSSRETWLRKPAMRCHKRGCQELVKFSKTKHIAEGGFQYCTMHGRERRRLRPFESLYRMTKKGCIARNLPFRLTLSQFSKLVANGTCVYCGIPLHTEPFFNRKVTRRQRTHLDRLDNAKGYTLKNIVTSCAPCNLTRFRWMLPIEMRILGQLRAGNIKQAQALCKRHAHTIAKYGETLQKMDKFCARSRS